MCNFWTACSFPKKKLFRLVYVRVQSDGGGGGFKFFVSTL